ncbi:MAG: hypothetical protein SNJ84_06240 [Verrucomicrobiia bacterium]
MTVGWVASWWQVALALVLVVGAVWAGFRQWDGLGRRRGVLGLEVIRLAAVVMLALTFLQLEVIRSAVRLEAPEVVVLVDRTGSMETVDVPRATGAVSRALAVERVLEDEELMDLLRRQGTVVEEVIGGEGVEGTDLGEGLDRVANRRGNVRAVVLLSDGDWNMGNPPGAAATRLRQREVPVVVLGVGSDRHLPDVALELVAPPAYGLVGEQIAIPFAVRNYLGRKLETRVSLRVGRKEEASRKVVLGAGAWMEDALLWTPQKTGEYVLEVEVPVQPEEFVQGNNRVEVPISVRAETLKVLVVDSRPRWEFRFLRNALLRDPGVKVECVLFHPELGVAEGPTYLPRFPTAENELMVYDVVFLGDVGVGSGELTLQDVEALVGLVRQQGSGLVFLPGRRGRLESLLGTPLEELLPVLLKEGQSGGYSFPVEQRLALVQRGAGHFLTFLGKEERENEKIWRGLPGFWWCAPVVRNKPGSEVLATHATQRNEWGRLPLLVASNAGNGKVLFMGVESAWRWRRGVEDLYHYRFWSQVVRWMAHRRYLATDRGIRLSYAPERPSVGETIFLQAVVSDESGFPMRGGKVVGRAVRGEGRVEQFTMEAQEDGWGLYVGRLPVTGAGPLRVTVEASNGARVETEIPVLATERERVGQPANFAALREIAAVTGGAFFPIAEAREAFERVSVLPEPEPVRQRVRLWSHPAWMLGLAGLLVAYWTGRKLMGMV